jgi:hypothetical protein
VNLEIVLIRKADAAWPHAYAELGTDWKVAGVENGRVVEYSFGSQEDAQAFAERELGLSGTWADPDGDGNYCIVG